MVIVRGMPPLPGYLRGAGKRAKLRLLEAKPVNHGAVPSVSHSVKRNLFKGRARLCDRPLPAASALSGYNANRADLLYRQQISRSEVPATESLIVMA